MRTADALSGLYCSSVLALPYVIPCPFPIFRAPYWQWQPIDSEQSVERLNDSGCVSVFMKVLLNIFSSVPNFGSAVARAPEKAVRTVKFDRRPPRAALARPPAPQRRQSRSSNLRVYPRAFLNWSARFPLSGICPARRNGKGRISVLKPHD
jgi:hypothetical protein